MKKLILLSLLVILSLPSVSALSFSYIREKSTVWCTANLDDNATAIKWDVGESSTTGWITDLEYGKYFVFTAPYAGTYKIILYERLENGSIRKFARTVNIVYSSLNRTNYTLPPEKEPYLNLPEQKYYQLKRAVLNLDDKQFLFFSVLFVLFIVGLFLSYKRRR